MSYNLNEIPSGTIDGVNTTFTTANALFQLAVVTVDGAIYTGGVTISDNDITLDDAPTTSITVSYYDAAGTPAVTCTLLVSTVRTQFDLMKRDTTDVSQATFVQWCDWINKFMYRYVMGLDTKRLSSVTTIVDTTSEFGQYLPSDFNNVRAYGMGLYLVDGDNVRPEPELITAPNSEQTGYYVKEGRVYFTPQNRPNSTTYQLRYVPNEPNITAYTDTFIAPLRAAYMEMLVNDLNRLYSQWDEDLGFEGVFDQKRSILLDEFARNIKTDPAVYLL